MGILDGGAEPFHYADGEVFALHRFVYGSRYGGACDLRNCWRLTVERRVEGAMVSRQEPAGVDPDRWPAVRKRSMVSPCEVGCQCRDPFASLKKTCRKQGVSFWAYLKDRVAGLNVIPSLAELIRQPVPP